MATMFSVRAARRSALTTVRVARLVCAVAASVALSGPEDATAQTITEFPIPTAGSAPYSITVGPDGALWFTENGANQIGRITTAGVITEFPLPNADSYPNTARCTSVATGTIARIMDRLDAMKVLAVAVDFRSRRP